jgi:hypothetical protein
MDGTAGNLFGTAPGLVRGRSRSPSQVGRRPTGEGLTGERATAAWRSSKQLRVSFEGKRPSVNSSRSALSKAVPLTLEEQRAADLT